MGGADVTHLHSSMVSRAVFLSAWTEFCRTNGSQEYWHRFGDYLFKDPPREIPSDLLSLPPLLPPKRRHRQPRPPVPDGLLTPAKPQRSSAARSKPSTVMLTRVMLKYVIIGHGTKRPRNMFTDADLDQFIAAQTRKDPPCPSTASRARHTGTSTSNAEVSLSRLDQSHHPAGSRKSRGHRAREGQGARCADRGGAHIAAARRRGGALLDEHGAASGQCAATPRSISRC